MVPRFESATSLAIGESPLPDHVEDDATQEPTAIAQARKAAFRYVKSDIALPHS